MSSIWDSFQEDGHRLYQEGLRGELAWALQFVHEHHDMHTLRVELNNILVLLLHVRSYEVYHLQAGDIIRVLGLLPYRLGYRADWERHLWFAATIYEQRGMHEEWAVILNHLADIRFHQGDMWSSFGIGEAISSLSLKEASLLNKVVSTVRAIDSLLYQHHTDEAHAMFDGLKTGDTLQNIPDELRPAALAQVQFIEGVLLRHDGKLPAARDALTGGIDLLPDTSSVQPVLAELYRLRGLTDWSMGNYPAAASDLRMAAHLHRQNMDMFGASITWGNLGLVYWSMAQLNRSEVITRTSIKIARHLGAELQELAQRINLGLVYVSKGWIKRALPIFQAQMKKAKAAGVISEHNRALGNRGIALYHLGRYEEARRDLERDAALRHKPLALADIYVNLSRCYMSLNNPDKAVWFAREALAISEKAQSTPQHILALRALAECDASSPVDYLEEALRLASAARRRLDEAGCLLMLASLKKDRALWRQGARILRFCEADAWLQGASIDHPPKIVLFS